MMEADFENEENSKLKQMMSDQDEFDEDWNDELQCRILMMIKKMTKNKITKASSPASLPPQSSVAGQVDLGNNDTIKLHVSWGKYHGKQFDMDFNKSWTIEQAIGKVNEKAKQKRTRPFDGSSVLYLSLVNDKSTTDDGFTPMSGSIGSYNLRQNDTVYGWVNKNSTK